MPYAVSQWPYAPDPRLPTFNAFGWDFGQVPPWQWTVETTGATTPFEGLNDGVRVKPTFVSAGHVQFRSYDALANGLVVDLAITGFEEPETGPPSHTIQMYMACGTDLHEPLTATIFRTYPTAIQEHGPFNLTDFGYPAPEVPNPVTITPRKWNA